MSNNPDIFDNGTPKYTTAQDIYDTLCQLVDSEEMTLMSEMFNEVSYEGADYYYTDKGYKFKEKFDEYCWHNDQMWILDLAVWQMSDEEIHDIIFQALFNDDMGKRVGIKKLFIDHMLHGNKIDCAEIMEAFAEEVQDLDRFSYYGMVGAFQRVMEARGVSVAVTPYSNFATAVYKKAKKLDLRAEIALICDARALLTSYDDFIYGLRSTHALYQHLEQSYGRKMAELKSGYEAMALKLLALAESQGVTLRGIEDIGLVRLEAGHA